MGTQSKKIKKRQGSKLLKLSINDRFAIINVLPDEGNILTLKLIRDIKNELLLNESEMKKINARVNSAGSVVWDKRKEVTKQIAFSEIMCDIIKKRLNELDTSKKLKEGHVGIYDIFAKEG